MMLGDARTTKPLVKNLALPLQATHYSIISSQGFVCSLPHDDEWIFSTYNNGPLYLERITIDGIGHLIITPASEATSERMKMLMPRIGISAATIQRKLSTGDYAGSISDSNQWLSAHDSMYETANDPTRDSTTDSTSVTPDTDKAEILYLQAQSFERISTLDPATALLILEKLNIKAPMAELANKQAGLLALRGYQRSYQLFSNQNKQQSPGDNTKDSTTDRINKKQVMEAIVVQALHLAQSIKGYHPDIENIIIPFFEKTSQTSHLSFFAARNSALTNAPDADSQLRAFILSNPDSDQTKEARFLLAKIQEDRGKPRESILTYQEIISRFSTSEITLLDGRQASANAEITRICTQRINDAEIYDVCASVNPSFTCAKPDLVLLPSTLCTPTLNEEHRCIATPEAAQGLEQAQRLAVQEGKSIEVVSAYRTITQQQSLYDHYQPEHNQPGTHPTHAPAPSRPSCTAPHVTGGALDVRFKGESMGDSPLSSMTYPNRKLLENIMCHAGFTRWEPEYWHYEIGTIRSHLHPAVYPTICAAP